MAQMETQDRGLLTLRVCRWIKGMFYMRRRVAREPVHTMGLGEKRHKSRTATETLRNQIWKGCRCCKNLNRLSLIITLVFILVLCGFPKESLLLIFKQFRGFKIHLWSNLGNGPLENCYLRRLPPGPGFALSANCDDLMKRCRQCEGGLRRTIRDTASNWKALPLAHLKRARGNRKQALCLKL